MTGDPPRALDDQDTKHLELVQSVISRLSNNSFLVKGWFITLSSVLVGVGDRSPDWKPVPVVVAVAVGFWLLDGYYLRQERMFRSLYERIIARGGDPPPVFTMDVARHGRPVAWPGVLLSRPLLVCYGVLATADILLILFLS
ncbi:hypothetical protein [Streptomyces sp. NPDC057877]|uniref:hypothetical protein n=1 Tax=Streptomyces sp. NPDC057877 TaxID=3346269 RepID=UPI0036AB3BFB